MAFLSARISRGKKYWSIVESRRVDGKPKNFILEYLGTADSLLARLNNEQEISINSYSHGDTAALINIANELNIVDTINKYIPRKITRNKCSVGASLLLAAIGRACRPTSKDGWYSWCKGTSLEYTTRLSLKELDSRHFWDQMDKLPLSSIPKIEEELIQKLVSIYNVELDTLLFDTTNFFTFIASDNDRCDLPKRGKNKQKRSDLRQVGMGLLVSRKEQLPLFHKSYEGNKNDSKFFSEVFNDLSSRIQSISEMANITIVFDKGNNSKDNFKVIDKTEGLHYVGGLVPSHFKSLIEEANNGFELMTIDDEEIPIYRIKKQIWGAERTCVITISSQLKEGQIRGIEQHLEKKYKTLQEFKQQLENKKKRKKFNKEELSKRLNTIIKGQFIDSILKYEFIELGTDNYSFTYFIDTDAYEYLKDKVLGRKIVVTNRHLWDSKDILSAYKGQSKVEYAFRNLKNPFHMAVRPQYHWTDQKIEVHFFTCIIGYLMSVAAYMKARKSAGYKKNISNFMDDLRSIRLSCSVAKKGKKVRYQLEKIPRELKSVSKVLNITQDNLRPRVNFSSYI